jgi:aminocarboxymuconate-semialdehyde decarboxylase
MIVDVHAHVIVPEATREHGDEPWRPAVWWEEGGQVVELGGKAIRSAVREFVRIDRILEEASSRGVEHLVLSPWVALLNYDLDPRESLRACRIQNDALAAMVDRHSNRISAFGAVPLQVAEEAADELQKVMSTPGLVGVEVGATVAGSFLGHDRLLPFWEAAEGTGAAVFVHPTTRGFDLPELQRYYLWNTVGNPLETAATVAHLVMAGVLERFPRLKVILAHGGGALPSVRGRLRHAHRFQPQARERLRQSPDESLRRLHVDTVTHDGAILRDLLEYWGPERVLLGSDYPFDMGTDRPVDDLRALGLAGPDEGAVLGANAMRLLGLKGA